MNVSWFKFIDFSKVENYMNEKGFNYENLRYWWTESIQIDFNCEVTGIFRPRFTLPLFMKHQYITRKFCGSSLNYASNRNSHYKEGEVMYKSDHWINKKKSMLNIRRHRQRTYIFPWQCHNGYPEIYIYTAIFFILFYWQRFIPTYQQ